MSKFQIILTGVFASFIVIGVLAFSLWRGGGTPAVSLTIWGTMKETVFLDFLKNSNLSGPKTPFKVTYVEKNPETFDTDFIEAIAEGSSPDLIFLPNSSIEKNKNKLSIIPFSVFSERDFKNSYVKGAEIFLTGEGIIGVPLMIDPMVLYRNRVIFSNNSISLPPRYWDEFPVLSEKVSRKDLAFNINLSAVALGEYRNVPNAKEIISTILRQSGNPIITKDEFGNTVSVLGNDSGSAQSATVKGISFYTEFSNPIKKAYSWNRSLPDSIDYFASGDLAVYLGKSSDYSKIINKNPNLDFDVSIFPQLRDSKEKIIYADITALAISKHSKKQQSAFQLAILLSSPEQLKELEKATNLPPVRRDMLVNKPKDPYLSVFYDSVLSSWSWYDPDKLKTDEVFKNMIESITSGKNSVSGSVSRAGSELNQLLGVKKENEN